MSRFARIIHIDAPATDVWQVMMDIETWPSWASQFKRLERLDSGPLAMGSRVRVRPARLPASVWEVTELAEGRTFTWESTMGPGVRLLGGHLLTPDVTGTNAEFSLEATGIMGRLLSPILRRTFFTRNTKSATEGLKRHVEGRGTYGPRPEGVGL
jgi:uncharacterized membrane protein